MLFDVTALGEVLIDFTPAGHSGSGNVLFEQNPGGAPANVLALLAKLGKNTAFIGKVGSDSFGRFLTQTLEESGIDTSGVTATGEASTTLAFVHLTDDGDRSFSFIRSPGADMMLQEDDINYNLVENCSVFHFGSISMTHDTAAAATIKAASIAKNKGAIISFDPNLRIPLWSSLEHAKSMIRKGLTYADVIKISEEELEFISGTADLAQGSEYIRDNYGVSIILVTLAEKGCFIRYGDLQFSVPGFKVVAVDTTGAGDAFLGGFLYRLLEKGCKTENLSEADLYGMARFANAAGALATTRKGAIPAMPSLAEIGELLQP